jgi:hypothetical protein
MQHIQTFLRLPGHERRLLLITFALVAALRLGLSTLPFRTLHSLVERLACPNAAAHHSRRPALEGIAWSIAVAVSYLPAATCLTQALAARLLLSRYGYPSVLRIGVARDPSGAFHAHAWVESAGQVIVGGPPEYLAQYIPLPSLEDLRP